MNAAEKRAVVGLAGWAVYLLVAEPGPIAAFVVLAVLVHVPLALALVTPESGLDRTWPIPAGLFVAASVLEPGWVAGLLAAPWLLFTVTVAAGGARRLAWRGLTDWRDALADIGCFFLAIGGAWAFAARAGLHPLGFAEPWVSLTAVHFHYAAFLLPVIVSAAGRTHRSRWGRSIAAALVVAVPMTAVGIAWSPLVETIAALLLISGALAATAVLWSKAALRIPALALAAAMLLAAGWVLAPHLGYNWLTIEEMAWTHGALNAVLFSAAALFALGRIAQPPSPSPPPFSALRGRGPIGGDWFERTSVTVDRPATGLVDDLADLDGPGFDADAVAPPIRAFYEHTQDFRLEVTPHWSPWVVPFAKLWSRFARRVDQCQFPLSRAPNGVRSRIVALDGDSDGRPAPRGWVRTFADGRAMYVAAYATHRHDDRGYMNIAFPFPLVNLASILAPRNHGTDGLILDTAARAGDHCGVWLVAGRFALRLPLREDLTIELAPDGELVARHVLRFCGWTYLDLDYRIDRIPEEHGGASLW